MPSTLRVLTSRTYASPPSPRPPVRSPTWFQPAWKVASPALPRYRQVERTQPSDFLLPTHWTVLLHRRGLWRTQRPGVQRRKRWSQTFLRITLLGPVDSKSRQGLIAAVLSRPPDRTDGGCCASARDRA